MSKLVTRTLSAPGLSDPVLVNYRVTPVCLGVAAVLSAGTATFNVELTLADPDDYATEALFHSNAPWFAAAGFTGATASAIGSVLFPVRALRLNATALAGGTLTLGVLQAGLV